MLKFRARQLNGTETFSSMKYNLRHATPTSQCQLGYVLNTLTSFGSAAFYRKPLLLKEAKKAFKIKTNEKNQVSLSKQMCNAPRIQDITCGIALQRISK